MTAFGGVAFGSLGQSSGDAAPPQLRPDEDVLDLRNPELRARPGDMRMADRSVALPRDEVRLVTAEAVEWKQPSYALDLGLG